MNESRNSAVNDSRRYVARRGRVRGTVPDTLFQAGDRVPAGLYRQVEGIQRQIHLLHEDYLPASLDGHVALYERVSSWRDVTKW